MKLATFDIQTPLGRLRRTGLALASNGDAQDQALIIDLHTAYRLHLNENESLSPVQAKRYADCLMPSGDMITFLEMGEPAMAAARGIQRRLEGTPPDTLLSMTGPEGERVVFRQQEVILRAPVPNPRMLRDFLSFEVHVQAGFSRRNEAIPEAWYTTPVYYKGNPFNMLGHDEPVTWPSYTRKFDYELELACIIGKTGRNIPVERAGEYIAGYAVMNDFSARDVQKGEMMCRLGPAKAKDFATGVGPWLVTADEVGDARNLRMTARINGALWSDGNSGTSHWTFEQMIAHVSREETLYAGDILGSGTVGNGCGFELERWPAPGDVMELEIEKLGILRNRVVPVK